MRLILALLISFSVFQVFAERDPGESPDTIGVQVSDSRRTQNKDYSLGRSISGRVHTVFTNERCLFWGPGVEKPVPIFGGLTYKSYEWLQQADICRAVQRDLYSLPVMSSCGDSAPESQSIEVLRRLESQASQYSSVHIDLNDLYSGENTLYHEGFRERRAYERDSQLSSLGRTVFNKETVCLEKIPQSAKDHFQKDLDISASIFNAWSSHYQQLRWETFDGLYKAQLLTLRAKEREVIDEDWWREVYAQDKSKRGIGSHMATLLGFGYPSSFSDIKPIRKEDAKIPYPTEEKISAQLSQGESLSVIQSFSLQAGEIWRDLVKCYSGNTKLARLAYYSAEFRCTDLSVNSDLLKQAIQDLRLNLANLLLDSTFIEEAKQLSSHDKTMLGYGVQVNTFRPDFPEFHPLLSQFLIEEYSRFFLVQEGVASLLEALESPESQASKARFLNGLLSFMDIVANNFCEPQGIFPLANRVIAASRDKVEAELLAGIYGTESVLIDYGHIPVGYDGTDSKKRQQCSFADYKLPEVFYSERDQFYRELSGIAMRYLPELGVIK